jgi:hypothetical protein
MKTKNEKKSRRIKLENIKKIDLVKSNFERKPSNKFVEVVMTSNEIKEVLGGKRISGAKILEQQQINYPKYYYGFINAANQMSGATKASNIGKLHIYFKNRKFRNLNEWKKYYLRRYPKSISNAASKIMKTIVEGTNIQPKSKRTYRKYVKLFVENLIFNQTYSGLKIQEVILVKIAKITKQSYRWSTSKEDSAGIDGFIGDIPVSIKPKTSKEKKRAGSKRAYYHIKDNKLYFTFSF